MSGMLPGEFVDEVRNQTDIVSLVSEYIHLRKAGRNYQGLCPFHGEKTPSFNVSREKQFFYCFGCGEGGNIFSFVMKMEGLTFPEAVRHLASRAGLTPPAAERSQAEEQRERLLLAVEWAAKYFRHHLDQAGGAAARTYLEQRKVAPATRDRFNLGYAPEGWDSLKYAMIKNKRFKEQELIAAGLLSENERKQTYDRFRNRLMFPIANQRGQVIAFGGRVLDGNNPKYLNSPETPLFDKGRNLYALNLAREAIRREKKAVIVEGYMDAIAAHEAGLTNTVASLGTALTEEQARLLRNQAQEVIIVYDADVAGQAATWRGLQVLREAGCLVRVGRLPEGLDPDDYIRTHGGENFRRQILDQSLLLVDYQLCALAEKFDLKKTEDRIRFTEKVVEVLAAVANEVEREDYLSKAAALLNVQSDTLRSEMKKFTRGQKPFSYISQPVMRKQPPGNSADDSAALQILAIWSQHPELMVSGKSQITQEDIPEQLREPFLAAQNEQDRLTPARLFELLAASCQGQLGRMLLQEEYERAVAEKALEDCIRHLKCARIARERKELEARMAGLDPVAAKGEVSELSRQWIELRRLEEALNRPREGGKVVG